jgi:hypothetical protein
MVDSPHLVIATPCYGGQVAAIWAESLLNLQTACRARGIHLSWLLHGSDALVTRARAELVARFLERPGATHLLFVDADIGFAPEQVFRLLDFDAEMTAAAYPLKRVDWPRVRRAVEHGNAQSPAAAHRYVYGVEDRARIEARGGFIKARYAGTGFLMIARGALMKLCDAHPELKYTGVHAPDDRLKGSPYRFALFECLIDPETGIYLSEDFAFCRRWTALGGEIWIDGRSRLTHVGPVPFVGDFSTQFDHRPAQNAEAATETAFANEAR